MHDDHGRYNGLEHKHCSEVAVTPAQVAAARAYIEISGGKDKVNEAVVRLAEAETRSHRSCNLNSGTHNS